MADGVVVALDIRVLLRLAGLDVLVGDLPLLSPFQQLAADVFRAVVDPYGAGFAAPFYDPVEASDDPFGGQREVDLDPQPLAVEAVQHVQQPECTAIAEAIGHEIHRPGHIRRGRRGQRLGLLAR